MWWLDTGFWIEVFLKANMKMTNMLVPLYVFLDDGWVSVLNTLIITFRILNTITRNTMLLMRHVIHYLHWHQEAIKLFRPVYYNITQFLYIDLTLWPSDVSITQYHVVSFLTTDNVIMLRDIILRSLWGPCELIKSILCSTFPKWRGVDQQLQKFKF